MTDAIECIRDDAVLRSSAGLLWSSYANITLTVTVFAG